MSWVLVEGLLSPEEGRKLVEDMMGNAPVTFKPAVLPSGRISEIVFLDENFIDIRDSRFSVRPIGWFGRTVRMAKRVAGCFLRVPRWHRLSFGLSLGKALFDLPGAYRLISEVRIPWSYEKWLEVVDKFGENEFAAIHRHIGNMAIQPRFAIFLLVDGTNKESWAHTITSLDQQLYRNFTCAVFDAGENVNNLTLGADFCWIPNDSMAAHLQAINAELGGANADDWVLLLRAGDRLSPYALYNFACEIAANPQTVAFYADDDVMDETGRRLAPRFKPDWSLTHFRATDFVGNALILHGKEVFDAGGLDAEGLRYGPYDVLLRVADTILDEGIGAVMHVPAVLLHCSPDDQENSAVYGWQNVAVERHLNRNELRADLIDILPGIRRVRFELPTPAPLVSVIIPTRDALPLIRQCVESLLEKTLYPRVEILVVDNQSSDPDVLAYLESLETRQINGLKIRVLHYNQRFNYSAINNFAVREASGELVCLLNNDTEVISPDWLDEMVGHLLQPRTGAVGAKLLYPDNRVQHAGILVGPGGCADHVHTLIAREASGYCCRAVVAQEFSAVTAACMLTWRDLYLQIGGLNERRLPVAFNDVDYCLRLREAGYKVVWSPHAELYHHESVSRGKDTSLWRKLQAEREIWYMRSRWAKAMQNDPYYNPNLSYVRPDFSLSQFSSVKKPWH